MDVRCEKCQTEYELDESRLKPGGVTVKCTNCGHMFKIRKRTPTNVGLTPADGRARTGSSKPPLASTTLAHGNAGLGPADDTVVQRVSDAGSGPNAERQWLVRLENGETKSCRELATLQQWIVAGVATRESLISRSGKTWKRLGDIVELGQYFTIADEARAQRAAKPTPRPVTKPPESLRGTMLGVGRTAAAGGTILPDDADLEGRTTGQHAARGTTTPPPPPSARTPPTGAPLSLAQTELAPSTQPPMRRPPTQPPPPPARAMERSAPHPLPAQPPGGRATAAWAASDIKQSASMAAMPQGPQGGNLAGVADERAFSGRARVTGSSDAAFTAGKIRGDDFDDDLLPARRGSRAGFWIAVISVLVIGAAAGVVYMVAFRSKKDDVATQPKPGSGSQADGSATKVVTAPADAAIVTPIVADAAAKPPSPLELARAELAGGVEPRLRVALDSLKASDDPAALALRVRLATAVAQDLVDRAGLVGDRAKADELRKAAKQLVVEAVPLAQRALKGPFATPADDVAANLAMAEVLRLQAKPARDVRRYLDVARGKPDKSLDRDLALATALVLVRDGKLDDADPALAAIDDPADMRVKLARALIALARGKPADAKPLVDQILATQPDHETAKLLAAKLDTSVAKTDPMPPEDGGKGGSAAPPIVKDHGTPRDPGGGGGGGDYDSLAARAGKLAESNCGKAIELYQKALEQKPNGVEALAGIGYCNLDAKQFSSAFSKFRAALTVSPRYEPALSGIAETYQQQGNKDLAIEAWRKVLDAYPSSAKAKKQLELLGADSGAGAGGGNSGGGGTGGTTGGGSTGGGAGAGSAAPTPTPTPPATTGSAAGSGA